MTTIYYILAAPYLAALAAWGYGTAVLAKGGVSLDRAVPESARALRWLPLVVIGAMGATLTYPLLVHRGAGIGAVLLTAGCSAALHLYLVYLALFHGVWALAAILRPEGKPLAEAVTAALARAAQARKPLTAALAAASVLLALKLFVLVKLMIFARANFPPSL